MPCPVWKRIAPTTATENEPKCVKSKIERWLSAKPTNTVMHTQITYVSTGLSKYFIVFDSNTLLMGHFLKWSLRYRGSSGVNYMKYLHEYLNNWNTLLFHSFIIQKNMVYIGFYEDNTIISKQTCVHRFSNGNNNWLIFGLGLTNGKVTWQHIQFQNRRLIQPVVVS